MNSTDELIKSAFNDEPQLSDDELTAIMTRSYSRGARRRTRNHMISSSLVIIPLVVAVLVAATRNYSDNSVASKPAAHSAVFVDSNSSIFKANPESPTDKTELLSKAQLQLNEMIGTVIVAQKTGTVFFEIIKDNDVTTARIERITANGKTAQVVDRGILFAVDPSGTRVLYSGDGKLPDGTDRNFIRVHNVSSGSDVPIVPVNEGGVSAQLPSKFAFSKDGKHFATLITPSNAPVELATFSSTVANQSVDSVPKTQLAKDALTNEIALVSDNSYVAYKSYDAFKSATDETTDTSVIPSDESQSVTDSGDISPLTKLRFFKNNVAYGPEFEISKKVSFVRAYLDQSGSRLLISADANELKPIEGTDYQTPVFLNAVVELPNPDKTDEKPVVTTSILDTNTGGWLPAS